MLAEELETIILLNDADAKEGYFCFSTSKLNHFERLIRRIGGEDKLLKLKVSRLKDGTPIYWDCHVPLKLISKVTFAIGKEKAPMTAERKEVLASILQKARIQKQVADAEVDCD